MNSIAYEIGAVFLLAAMLMFGSMHGFIPRSLRNAGAPIVIGIALAGFLIWRFGPDLSANFRSTVEWSFPRSQPSSVELSPAKPAPAEPPSAKPASRRPEPAPRPVEPVAPIVQTIVVREVPEAKELAPPAVQSITSGPIAEAPSTGKPIEVKPVAIEAQAKPVTESSGSSPYDSGVKRAVKSVGRFLHIGGKKNDPFAQ